MRLCVMPTGRKQQYKTHGAYRKLQSTRTRTTISYYLISHWWHSIQSRRIYHEYFLNVDVDVASIRKKEIIWIWMSHTHKHAQSVKRKALSPGRECNRWCSLGEKVTTFCRALTFFTFHEKNLCETPAFQDNYEHKKPTINSQRISSTKICFLLSSYNKEHPCARWHFFPLTESRPFL